MRVLPLCLSVGVATFVSCGSGLGDAELSGSRSAALQVSCDKAVGEAPMETTCQWAFRKSESSASCEIDFGDGTPPSKIEGCRETGSLQHAFKKPGQFRLVMKVSPVLTDSLEVKVIRPANMPPDIESFAASVSKGRIPFSSVLSWKISDEENDAMECAIDVGADGAIEHSVSPCTSSSTATVSVPNEGEVPVKLLVRDAKGAKSSQVLNLTGVVPTSDIFLSKVEWGQSVVSENPELVGGKAALLRLYVLSNAPGIQNISVSAEARLLGVSLGMLALTGPSELPQAPVDSDIGQQFRVVVPGEFIRNGVEIHVRLDESNSVIETDEDNNVRVLRPLVGRGHELNLTSVPVVHQGIRAATPAWDEILQRLWPLRGVNNLIRAPYTFSGNLAATGQSGARAWNSLLNQMAAIQAVDGSNRNYYGFVKVSYAKGIAGIGLLGTPVAVGRDDSELTFAHELGHNFGRQHAPCGNPADVDVSFPYSQAQIGSTGYDFVTNSLVPATNTFDVMSYCSPAWVSDYSYKNVQTFLTQNPSASTVASAHVMAHVVYGAISESGEVQLAPIHQVLAAKKERVEKWGRFVLRMHADGRVEDVPLETSTSAEEIQALNGDGHGVSLQTPPASTTMHHFAVLVEGMKKIDAVEILDAGRVVFRKVAASETADHSLRVVERRDVQRLELSWNSKTYTSVQLAHVDGQSRTTLALNLQNGAASVDVLGIPEGGKWEIVLSDGVNSVRQEVVRNEGK